MRMFFLWAAVGFWALAQPVEPVRIAPFTAPLTLQPGGSAEIALRIEILPPWHVNAHEPSQKFLIPSSLELSLPPGFTAEERWPAPEKKELAISRTPLELYSEDFVVTLVLRAEKTLAPGDYAIEGKFLYQACNDEVCLPPAAVSFTIPVGVIGVATAESSAPSAQSFPAGGRGFLWVLGAAFLVGLGLNLTPCVYPMVPVTVGYFVKMAGAKLLSTLGLALTYLLGIALTYSILGVLVALGGGMLGQALQHPAVLGFLAAVMVALALSFFGVYTFRAPAALTRRLPKGKAGLWGTLLMGMVVGLVAAPCVGPATVAFISYVASLGDPLRGFFLFFALSLGLGLPYVGLALLSGKLQRLPKAGTWTVWVEHLLGMFLLGMALYFLFPILPGLGRKVGLVVLAVGGGAFLLFSALRHRQGRVLPALGALAFAAGLGLAGWSLIPPPASGPKIPWVKYTPGVFSQAEAEGRPVVLYFSANWCPPCQELSATTFRSARVREALEKIQALPVKVDLTTSEPAEDEVRRRFGVVGVPTVIFLNPRGTELRRFVGYFPETPFLQAIRELFGGG